MKKLTAAIGAGLLLASACAGSAVAQDEFAGAINARQGLMALFGANAGPLFAMAKGDMEYDAEAAEAYANNLLALATIDQRNLWPEGSDSESLPGRTRAKPEIWSTYPEIVEHADALADAATNLVSVAGTGQEALGGAVGGVGQACGACHEDFRAPSS